MIRTTLFVALGAVLGFAVVFSFVPRRPPEPIPPNWVSLPGTPVAVNDIAVGSWDEANQVLRRLVGQRYYEHEGEPGTMPRQVESGLGEYRVTYVPSGGGRRAAGTAPETVTIRAWLPITVDYSRASGTQLTRFEVVRGSPVE